ncbi:hypothetical protein ACLX1H_006522 [Fusarium chlamydosporum]
MPRAMAPAGALDPITTFGRRAVNKQLSEHLTNTSLFQDWIVTPAPARITRDHYVPIEVSSPAFLGTIGVPFPFHDLAYRDTSNPDQESSDVSLRCLFNNTLASEIQTFFNQQTTEPLQMNVFPIGDKLADDVKSAFTHFYLFFSLELDVKISVENTLSVNRNILTETMQVLQGQLKLGQAWHCLKKEMSNTELGRQIAKQYGNDDDITNEDIGKIKSCWQESVTSLELFQSLATQIKLCVSNLTGDQRATISKEEVHLTLIQANLATIAFSDYQKHMLTVVETLQKKYEKDANSSTLLLGLAVAVVLIAGGVMTGGLGIAPIASGVVGLGLGADQSVKLRNASQKGQAVSQLDESIDNLADALKDAKIGLASIYCSEVLQMPFQSMGTRERIEVLKKLGVDMKELEVESIYNQELLDLRMGRFNDAYEKFHNEREAVKKNANVKEWAEIKAK